MAIVINNLKIINDGSQLLINIQTDETYFIDSISFWTMATFKDIASSIDLSIYLSKTSNIEDLTINASDIGVSKFEDIIFIEAISTYDDLTNGGGESSPTIGAAYDLSSYYGCILKYIMEIPLDCKSCTDIKNNDSIITINMLIDTSIKALNVGYYTEAISMINNLKVLCRNSCGTVASAVTCTSCNNFIQL